jgi:hypothetical protein
LSSTAPGPAAAKTETRASQAPPADVSASELYLAMMALPLPHEVVDFPLKEPVFGVAIGKVAIVPLAPEDLMICRKVAGEWSANMTGERPKAGDESPAYQEIFGDEAAVQILWRALRDPKDKTLATPSFPAPAVIRRKPFSADLLAVLMKMYRRACVMCGPIVATMTETEQNAWLDALEEGGSAFPLDLLSSASQSELLMRSARRCKALRMGNSSSGSPPGAPPSDVTPAADKPPPESTVETPPSAVADELVMPPAAK